MLCLLVTLRVKGLSKRMDKIMKGLEYKIALNHIEDIIAFGETMEEFIERLVIVFRTGMRRGT